MKYFRIFGCKAYVRESSRGDIRKDWSDRSKVGVLIGYSETPLAWVIYIPEMGSCVTSVHVRFNEDIPDYYRIEYFQELENEILLEQRKERDAQDYLYLVGTVHVDDEDLMKYVVTSIAITNDKHKHIIAYRSPIFLDFSNITNLNLYMWLTDAERMYAATLGLTISVGEASPVMESI